jgi:hypothetical protein
MKCEEFLREWQQHDLFTGEMKKHLAVCESCRAKVKDYNDILLNIKEDKYPHTIDVVNNVMQQIAEKPLMVVNKPKRKGLKPIVTASLSAAAMVALLFTVQRKVEYNNRVRLQNEEIAAMFLDVYGYDQSEQYASFNQLDVIEYFLENYEV